MARPMAKACSALLAMWLMVLPLCGMLRVAPLLDGLGSGTSTMLLEEEVHPAEVTWQPLLSAKADAPDMAGHLTHPDDVRHLSHHGEVPHLPPWS